MTDDDCHNCMAWLNEVHHQKQSCKVQQLGNTTFIEGKMKWILLTTFLGAFLIQRDVHAVYTEGEFNFL